MDIVVKISTTFDDPVDSAAHGLVALLNTVLKTVKTMNTAEVAFLGELYQRYGPDSAEYLKDLLPELGEVLGVEFVVPAAAGEEESPLETWIPLDEGQRARAQQILGQAFKAFVVGEYLNICPTTGTLVGWVKAHGDWHLLSHTVSKAILRHILGENRDPTKM